MDKAAYTYLVDWDGDGSFDHAYSNISAYVLNASWDRGSESPEPGNTKAGTIRIKLDNSTSIFSPDDDTTPSPIYGLTLPGRRIKITMTIGGGAAVTMAAGYLETIDPVVGDIVGVSIADLVAYGILAQNVDAKIFLAMQTNLTTGAAMNAVLAAVPVAAGDKAIDTGQTTLSRFFAREQSVLQLLRELEAAETGLLGEGKDGKLTFEDRAHRASAPHTTVQATYGTGTLNIWDLKQNNALPGIFNYVETAVRTFNKSDDVTLAILVDVANGLGGAPIPIAAAEVKTIWIEIPTPNSPAEYLAVDTWGICTYEVNTEDDGTGTDITNTNAYGTGVSAVRTEYGNKIKLVFTNNNSEAGFFIVLKINGNAIVEGDSIPISSENTSSQTNYKKRTYPNPSRWITDIDDGKDYCDHLIALYKDPRTRLTFTLKANYNAAHLAEAQRLDIGDRIHVTANAPYGLFVDADFFVDYLAHSVDSGNVHNVQIGCSAVVTHSWAADATSKTSIIVTPEGPADDLYVNAIDPGTTVTFGVMAEKYAATVFQAEFRAKLYSATALPEYADLRTAAEGGTLAHDGTTQLVITGLGANYTGCQYIHRNSTAGVWYFAWRLKNRTWRGGWSVWSDGNSRPTRVTDRIATEASGDTGQPSGWTLAPVTPGPLPNTVIVSAPRPPTNGKKIIRVVYQIKDSSTGSWRTLDANAGAASVIYDGSAIDHSYSKVLGTITKASGNYGSAATGDLILFDVRDSTAGGWSWDEHCCQHGTVVSVSGATLSGLFGFRPTFAPTADVYAGMRIMIVRPFWDWNTEGYLGDEANKGIYSREYWSAGQRGDLTTTVFVSEPIAIPSTLPIQNVQARVIFENMYSASDNDTYSGSPAAEATSGYRITIPDASPIAIDAALSDTTPRKIYFVQLTAAVGNTRELSNMTNAKDCQPIAIIFRQDSVGSRAVTLDDKYVLCDNVPNFDLSVTAYSQTLAGFVYDAIQDTFLVVSLVTNFDTGVGPSVSPSASSSASASKSLSASASSSASAS